MLTMTKFLKTAELNVEAATGALSKGNEVLSKDNRAIGKKVLNYLKTLSAIALISTSPLLGSSHLSPEDRGEETNPLLSRHATGTTLSINNVGGTYGAVVVDGAGLDNLSPAIATTTTTPAPLDSVIVVAAAPAPLASIQDDGDKHYHIVPIDGDSDTEPLIKSIKHIKGEVPKSVAIEQLTMLSKLAKSSDTSSKKIGNASKILAVYLKQRNNTASKYRKEADRLREVSTKHQDDVATLQEQLKDAGIENTKLQELLEKARNNATAFQEPGTDIESGQSKRKANRSQSTGLKTFSYVATGAGCLVLGAVGAFAFLSHR